MRISAHLCLLVAAVSVCGVSPCASAGALIATDWKTPGDARLTWDRLSGLEWLDLSETLNLSYSQVVSELGAGGRFAGFRYATEAEFRTLLTHAGILGYEFSGAYYEPARALQALLGVSYSSATQANSFGLLADPAQAVFDRRGVDLVTTAQQFATVVFGDQTNAAWSHKGSWLVRLSPAAVPEPSAVFLWGLAGCTATLVSHRRRNRFGAVAVPGRATSTVVAVTPPAESDSEVTGQAASV